ncbi:hypothetical protein [Crocinitomix algicola]|uniref:hypothetical protein n=1 Tax=Crocinitomix algicola TaxID=1740263 RepID=UPI000872E018|nr:hypothetical protein [Crocinitomix algicola]
MIIRLFFICAFIAKLVPANSQVRVEGEIGKYPIAMVFSDLNYSTGVVNGRYRYKNQNNFLDLKGQIFGDCMYLEERFKNEVTGEFFLNLDRDSITGYWISGNSSHRVKLVTRPLDSTFFKVKTLEEFSQSCDMNIDGGYGNQNYFINDWFYSKDRPSVEMGFNGGTLLLEQIGEDSLKFDVNVVCGPTYHFASASGIAIRKSSNLFHSIVKVMEGDTCQIWLEIEEKKVHVWASETSFSCGFGARAYLDHDFIKITNKSRFDGEIWLEDLKQMAIE